jgi:hypothetical protein
MDLRPCPLRDRILLTYRVFKMAATVVKSAWYYTRTLQPGDSMRFHIHMDYESPDANP